MIIALNDFGINTVIGIYENLYDFAFSNFQFELTETRNVKVSSYIFKSYKQTEIISPVSYTTEYSEQEAIQDYIKCYFLNHIKPYSIKVYKIEDYD